jgi:hypothetical protein
MKLRRFAVCVCLFLGSAAGAQETEFPDAVRDYRAGHWSAAYGRLIVLANNGHRDAARMALFMHQYGLILYGTRWEASAEDVQLWTRTAGSWQVPGEPDRIASVKQATQPPAASARPRAWRFQGRASQR